MLGIMQDNACSELKYWDTLKRCSQMNSDNDVINHQKKQKTTVKTEYIAQKVSNSDNCLGAGGCIACSLAFLGILSKKPQIVKSKLNNHINNCQQDFAGIINERWHANVIKAALVSKYGIANFTFQKCGIQFLRGKSYILDGILNAQYLDPQEVKNYGYVRQEDSDTFDCNDPIWRHSIALLANKSKRGPSHFIGCRGIHGGFGTIELLHLQEDPYNPSKLVPNREKGYMHTIMNVYEIQTPHMNKIPKMISEKHVDDDETETDDDDLENIAEEEEVVPIGIQRIPGYCSVKIHGDKQRRQNKPLLGNRKSCNEVCSNHITKMDRRTIRAEKLKIISEKVPFMEMKDSSFVSERPIYDKLKETDKQINTLSQSKTPTFVQPTVLSPPQHITLKCDICGSISSILKIREVGECITTDVKLCSDCDVIYKEKIVRDKRKMDESLAKANEKNINEFRLYCIQRKKDVST
jgi:predicted nucleic acid binding AN1-type Zn finger protein